MNIQISYLDSMKKLISTAIVYLLFICLHAQVTIENIMSAPFPTELQSSVDGKHLAWVFNDKGVRNIFIADAPDFAPRKVTKHNSDDGIEIGGLQFSADGTHLFFHEGNNTNGAGEAANPAFLQEKTGETIWVANTDGSGLRKIGVGNNAIASPDGKTVLYSYKGKAWQSQVTDTSKSAIQLFEARGVIGDLRFSPDGKKLAFISHRSDHAFLGVYDFTQKSLDYLDPTIDNDIQPAWSPDGKYIAYIRIPSRRGLLPFTELRKGFPWSIHLFDLAKNEAKEIWKADEGRGSVLYTDFPVADNLLLWTADNQLVFPWEKDGWQHLYSVPIFSEASNRKAQLLTPGDGEVEYMQLSSDQKSVIYNTNIGDSHRRHIWTVNAKDGNAKQLSKGEGIEWSPVNVGTGIAVLRSTATTPGWPTIIKSETRFEKVGESLFPAAFPDKLLVTPSVVSFQSKDNITIHGQLFLPPGYQKDKKYPTLLFFHGGSRRQMLQGFHYMGYYSKDYGMNQYYASKGYIVLAVNYRSGIGYGMEFREALHYGANGGSEYNDVVAAGQWLQKRADVNIKRIGLWGGSYGGYLTAMGLSRNSDIFACGVDIHGVHDWNQEMKNWVANYDPTTRAAFAKIALAASPISSVDGWKSPVLFIHGDDDRNVPFEQTEMIAEKLRERKIYFEELVFPDDIHDFLLHKNWLKGYRAAADFFERKMK